MKKSKEEREFDEMMREEIESGNPFAGYSSYASYKAKNSKKPIENKEILKAKVSVEVEINEDEPF